MPLSDYKPYLTNLVTGLAGAATGGGLTYLGTQPTDGESPDEFQARRRGNATTGAIAGGTVGAALPSLARPLAGALGDHEDKTVTAIKNVVGQLNPFGHPYTAGTVAGAATGGTLGWGIGKGMSQAGAGGKMITGPNPIESKLQSLKDMVDKAVADRGTALGEAEKVWNRTQANIAAQHGNAQAAYKNLKDRFGGGKGNGFKDPAVTEDQVNQAGAEAGDWDRRKTLFDQNPSSHPDFKAMEEARLNTGPEVAAQAARQKFEDAVKADQNTGFLGKIFPNQAEGNLLKQMDGDAKFLRPRQMARRFGVAGAVLPGAFSWYLNH